jgi:hypothetical protein
VDLAVDVLRLILYSAKNFIGVIQNAIEHVLSIVEHSPFRLLNVPEYLSVGDDEG